MHICFTLSSLSNGGAERVAATLSNYFSKKGHKVSLVLASIDHNNAFFKLDDGVDVYPLIKNKKDKNPLVRVKLLRKALLQLHPDIVIAFLPHICIYTYLALRRTKIPFICSERNDPNQYSFFYKILLKKSFRKANGCVFQTEDAMRFYKRTNKTNAKIIRNPVFLQTNKTFSANNGEKLFVSVGRLTKQKNFNLLIESFYEFHKTKPEYKLIIFGEGPLRTELTNLVASLNLSDSVLLPGSKTDWHNTVINSKGFISSSNYEGMPNCLEEALCLGCPCVATDCPIGGSKDLINLFGFGKLVPPNDKDALINSMVELSESKVSYGTPNHSVLDIDNVGEEWLAHINMILN